ncbi:hypothetical protein ACFS5L_16645 [Streptomyces phyllanthi]|uniref:Tetratricopeptide repeat protein n=1 Tax=Streptomyces phyllanthi TaxID=1803180 RepID=A0A5N8W0D0_9ACTN|nr:hypothetical protein [Streptomyces phyllanthi]MPY39748.1 hypothetical protein [Streptomyces phyllanthi]
MSPPDGLILGIDIEELYFDFGDAHRLFKMVAGIQEAVVRLHDDKVMRVRDAVWALPGSSTLVPRLDDLLGRECEDPAKALDRDLERAFDRLMGDVRGALSGDAVFWYDTGVFLARFSLCVNVVAEPPDQLGFDFEGLYRKELARVGPLLAQALLRVSAVSAWLRASLPLRRQLGSLLRHLAGWDGGSTDWCRTARERTDRVFSALGMTHSGTSLPHAMDAIVAHAGQTADEVTPDEEAADELTRSEEAEFSRRESELVKVLLAGDAEAAEEGLRALVQTGRRTIGARHPHVLMAQATLCLALHALRRTPLCVDLAHDTADEARLHLGDRHPVTASVARTTWWLLHVTGRDTEAAEFMEARLAWLLSARSEELSPELWLIRETFADLVQPPGPTPEAREQTS